MLPRFIHSGMLTKRLLPLLLCFNIALLAFYLLVGYQLVYHSDSAVKNLLAQEIYETGQLFPQDWNYVNHDLWVFNTHTFIVPLLPFLRNGMLAHAISDLVAAALTLYGTWLLTGLLEQSRMARLLGMLVISGGMSLIMAEHIFGQAAYGLLYFMACYLLVAYWSLTRAQGRRQWLLWGAATIILTMLTFWANPQRALLSYGLPLFAAAIVQHLLERREAQAAGRRADGRHAKAMAVVALGLVAGTALSFYTLSKVSNSPGLTLLNWLDFNGMLQNLLGIIKGTMILFDGLPNINDKVVSASGVYMALRMTGAALLVCMLPWALYRALQLQRGPRQLVVVFACVSFAVHLFMMVTTSLADMRAPEASVRYLVPSLLYMLLIIVGLMVDHDIARPVARYAAIGAIALLATSAPATYLYPFKEVRHMPHNGLSIDSSDQQLIAFMKQNGLLYGYATFWNANKITVLSDSITRVRPVSIEHGLPRPHRTLSSNRWYMPTAWQGETFLMLLDAELPHLNRAALDGYAGQPRLLRFRDINFLVYPKNLAASLPDWDVNVTQRQHYPMEDQSLHQIGALSAGAMVAQPGEKGTLHFGPMRILAPGAYAVSFDLDAEGGTEGDFGRIDVSSGAGSKIHAEQNVTTAGKQRITLRFESAQTLSLVEFRAFSSGRGRLALSGIDLERIPTALEKP